MHRALLAALLIVSAARAEARQPPSPSAEDVSIAALLQAVEAAVSSSDQAAWLALVSPLASRDTAIEFFGSTVPDGVTRAVVRERERARLLGTPPGEGYALLVDVFTEIGARGRITTWVLEVRRPRDAGDQQPWRIVSQQTLSLIDGLHRLSLDADKQYRVRDFRLRAVDLELQLSRGDVFVAGTADGVTGIVLIGDGTMIFTPKPAEERGQVRIFAGSDTIDTSFDAAYIRLNPFEFQLQTEGQLGEPVTPDGRQLRRAQSIFDEEVGKSFSLDLRDLSRDNWSLLPQVGDFLAEVRTRRYNTLTYARSTAEAEDVTLFHRERKRNIAVYASEMKLSSRGRFYDEDDLVDYDVLDYAVDTTFSPDREWLDGRTRLRLRVKAFALAALTIKLAEELTVHSITTRELGRLMFLRVRHQDSVVVNLPSPVPRDAELTLEVAYSGRIDPQAADQETVAAQRGAFGTQRVDEFPFVPPEPKWLFSNRSYWYPQGQVTDYATAVIRFTVPADYAVVASGVEVIDSPVVMSPAAPGQPPTALHVFIASQPVRYLGAVVSKFQSVDAATVALDILPPAADPSEPAANGSVPGVGTRNTVALAVKANRRQEGRGRDVMDTAAEILRLYSAVVGDVPYDAMTIAMVEHDRPGGHSPGYFAVLNNPPPITPFTFRNDPATFSGFPEFFVAHELAHQWWGQAVGWKNYHEQWLSEGFAQYFAALYAKERRGEQTFRDVLKQFRRWAMEQSDQGAVYLGYRLGHIKGDSRVFRALVYNKGAMVLHMLRRLVGDDAFFRGIRRYYAENRFQKAGTEDLQRAMQAETERPLERFFERWIYASGLPRIRYSTEVERDEVIVRFEQVGEIYDVPVTVTLTFSDRTVDEVVALTEARSEWRFPRTGSLRGLAINGDHAALGDFNRR